MTSSRLSATQALIIINIVVFIVGMFVQQPASLGIPYGGGAPTPRLEVLGAYSWFTCFMQKELWRLVTYQFLHANFAHILFNMWGLYFFGPAVEDIMGAKKFLAFYLVCGIAGALCSSLLADIGLVNALGNSPQAVEFCSYLAEYGAGYYGSVETWQMVPLIGASAAVYGVMVATAFLYPDVMISLIFPPITLKLRTFAIAIMVIASLTVLFNMSNAGGEAGHLGGIVMGALIMTAWKKGIFRSLR